MTLEQILKGKGKDILSIHQGETMTSVAQMLQEKRVGALLVMDSDGGLQGVISERDLVRAVASEGEVALGRLVSAFMTSDLVLASADDTIDEALGKMTRRRIRHLPVMRGEELVGVISIGDLVKNKIAEAEAETDALKSYIHA